MTRGAPERLRLALVSLAAAGGRPPCGDFRDANLWTSESAGDRAVAVVLCTGCPVLELCGAAAEETGDCYVRGGRDLGIYPRKPKPPV